MESVVTTAEHTTAARTASPINPPIKVRIVITSPPGSLAHLHSELEHARHRDRDPAHERQPRRDWTDLTGYRRNRRHSSGDCDART